MLTKKSTFEFVLESEQFTFYKATSFSW